MDPRPKPSFRACPVCLAAYEEGYTVCARDGAELVERAEDPLVGHELERYRIESVIGSGAMGRVYRAQHVRLSRQFALKLMYGNLAADARMRKRFAREAEAASRLSHPNLITVVDVGETASGLPYLAMDLVEGESLFDVISRDAPLPTERAVAIARGMLRGLGHAHARGLVHRDLKPANVLLTRDDGGEEVARIVDFGLALVHESAIGRVTTASLVFGTPEYMAPEQAYGESDIDARADLFALGIILYEMLSGVLPFSGRSVDIMRKNVAATVPPFAERAPHVVVAAPLEALVMKLMAKERGERHASAAEVLEALDAAVPGGRSEPRGGRARSSTEGDPPTASPVAAEVTLGGGRAPSTESDPPAASPVAAEVTPRDPGVSPSGTIRAPHARRRRGRIGVALAAIAALGLVVALVARGSAPGTADRSEAGEAGGRLAAAAPSTPSAAPLAAPPPSSAAPLAAPPPSSAAPLAAPPPSSAAPLAAPPPSSAAPLAAPPPSSAAPPAGAPSAASPALAPGESPSTSRPSRRERAALADRPQKSRDPTSARAAPAVASAEQLVGRYRRLGERLDALARSQPDLAGPLRKRYFAIPLADALRRPELRGEVGEAIGAIERHLPVDPSR